MLRNVTHDPEYSVEIRSVTGEIVRCPKSVQDALLTYENGLISVEDLIFAPEKYDLILGITLLHDANLLIDWKTKTLTFPKLPLPTSPAKHPEPRTPTPK
jgi:hypothetical protein